MVRVWYVGINKFIDWFLEGEYILNYSNPIKALRDLLKIRLQDSIDIRQYLTVLTNMSYTIYSSCENI